MQHTLVNPNAVRLPVLAHADAALISNALGEYLYTQGIVGFFSFENTLDDIGGWFHSL